MAKFVPQAELPVSEQAQIRREKLAALQAEGRDPFVQTKFDFNADSAAIKADYETYEGKTVRVAGRLMSKRGQGKVMFCDLQDAAGRIQLYLKFDEMDEAEFEACRKLDISRPIWLDKHQREWDEFGLTRFLPDDFLESVDFQRMEIEFIDPDAKKRKSADYRNAF